MKKLLNFLVICLTLVIFISCGHSYRFEDYEDTITTSNDTYDKSDDDDDDKTSSNDDETTNDDDDDDDENTNEIKENNNGILILQFDKDVCINDFNYQFYVNDELVSYDDSIFGNKYSKLYEFLVNNSFYIKIDINFTYENKIIVSKGTGCFKCVNVDNIEFNNNTFIINITK